VSEPPVSNEQILAYLDEMLPVDEMASLEQAMRRSESLRTRASGLVRRRDQGVHAVGEIWRRLRLSCPARGQLGSYLLGTLDSESRKYIEFHTKTVGCRVCSANLDDLEQSRESSAEAPKRRSRIFQSSAGYLKKGE